jgi:hypothetical protein
VFSSPSNVAKCRLCRGEKRLRRSHIILEFFSDNSGLMYPTGKSRRLQPFTQPIHTHPGKRFDRKEVGYWEKRHGMVEYLLCEDCEQRFSGFEDYAKRLFYGDSSPIRLQLPLLADPLFIADYKKLKLFQLSILWRAAEAKGEFYSAVDLGQPHRERLRKMLLNEEPGTETEYLCGLTRLVIESPAILEFQRPLGMSIETGFFAPVRHDHGTWESFLFVMGGLLWIFCISSTGVPEVMQNSYIRENGQFWLMPMKADDFLIDFCRKAVEAGNVTEADAKASIAAKSLR